MSRSIWKYEIPVDDQWHEINMASPARVVHVASTGGFGTVCAWVEVIVASEGSTTRRVRVFGTGQAIPDGAAYVGTALAGPFVWHVYEEPQP